MIVPRNRLLWWVAAVVPACSVVAIFVPAGLGICVSLILLLALVAAGDGWAARRSLGGIELAIPAVVRMSRHRPGKIELRIRNPRQRQKLLRLALVLPREVPSVDAELEVRLPSGTEWSRLIWLCTPRRRGRYLVEISFVETESPLGFWAIRQKLATPSEVRIYPNLLAERRNLAALFLNRGAYGVHARRQVGKGRDFEKLREYVPGDSYEEIHWKATARRGHPITKVYQVERTQEVYVVVDTSRLSARTQMVRQEQPAGGAAGGDDRLGETTVLERFVTASLILGMAAERQGDLFGLLTFADRAGTFVRARNGAAHYSACRDALYTVQPSIVTPDYDDVCSFIRLRLRRRALVVFLTSLDDPLLAGSLVSSINLICRQHLVLVGMIQPPGVAPLFSSADAQTSDDLFRHLGGHLLWQKLREVEKTLKNRGVRFALLKDERMCGQLVAEYMDVKQRQLL